MYGKVLDKFPQKSIEACAKKTHVVSGISKAGWWLRCHIARVHRHLYIHSELFQIRGPTWHCLPFVPLKKLCASFTLSFWWRLLKRAISICLNPALGSFANYSSWVQTAIEVCGCMFHTKVRFRSDLLWRKHVCSTTTIIRLAGWRSWKKGHFTVDLILQCLI